MINTDFTMKFQYQTIKIDAWKKYLKSSYKNKNHGCYKYNHIDISIYSLIISKQND